MGTWGTGVFENDDAADFLAGLYDAGPAERAATVREALRAAAEADAYLDVDEGQAAIAAAAVMAAARAGRPVTAFGSGGVIEAADLPRPDADLLALAVRALDRVIAGDSEWRELWQESPDQSAALGAVTDIRAALT